jgi:hypothetical protein
MVGSKGPPAGDDMSTRREEDRRGECWMGLGKRIWNSGEGREARCSKVKALKGSKLKL